MGDQSLQVRPKPVGTYSGSDKIRDAIDKIEEDIVELKASQDSLQKQIGERETGKDEYLTRRREMQDKLAEYQKYIDDYEGQRQAVWKEIDSTQAETRSKRDKLDKEKKALPYRSVEQIDQEIAKIEHSMWSQSFNVAQEKKMIVEISELKKLKPQLVKVQAMESPSDKEATGDLHKRLTFLNQSLKDARDAKKAQMDQFRKLNEQRDSVRADMSHLFDQRSKYREDIKRKITQKRELVEEKRTKERAERALQAELKAAKSERQRAERLNREASYLNEKMLRRFEQEEDPPHLLETTRIEQIMAYCRTLMGEPEEVVEEAKAETKHDNPKGSVVLASKKDRKGDNWVVACGHTKVKKEKKVKKTDKIKHTVDSLKMFVQFKLDPPLTTAEVTPIMEKLQAKLDGFKEKVKEWESQRDQRRSENQRIMDETKEKVEDLQNKAAQATAHAKEMTQTITE